MKDPDPLLARAGLVAMQEAREVGGAAGQHFDAVLAEPGFANLTDDAARTQYLRRRVAEELSKDETIKAPACAALARRAADLALEVQDCPPASGLE